MMKKIGLCLMPYALCLALAACGGKDKLAEDAPLPDIYARAYSQLDKRDYTTATATFQDAERQYPASQWAADALVMAAYSAYMDNDFANALIITDRFMRFHPGHADVPYVLYLRGMSYYRQVSDVRREPGMSVYAMQAFQTLVDRFPNSEYADSARNKIMILKNYVAGKMMYSARRDMNRENWAPAIEHLQQIIASAQETQMTPEALYRLTEAYTAIGLPEQAAGYADMLRLNFPDNEWTKKLK